MNDEPTPSLPETTLDIDRMPAYSMLARLGKRVLRPGGVEATARLARSTSASAVAAQLLALVLASTRS